MVLLTITEGVVGKRFENYDMLPNCSTVLAHRLLSFLPFGMIKLKQNKNEILSSYIFILSSCMICVKNIQY